MKKLLIIFSIIGLIVASAFILDFVSERKKFKSKIIPIVQNIRNGKYMRQLLDDYYLDFGQYPNHISELDSIYFGEVHTDSSELIELGKKFAFEDPFSRNGSPYYFKPVYSRITNTREGYVLLSRGPDGRIDNVFNDTLYLSDTYIINDYLENVTLINAMEVEFNYFNKYFGDKDYNLNPYESTGFEMLKMNAPVCISVDQLVSNMKDDIEWKVACLKLATKNLSIVEDNVIYIENSKRLRINFKGPPTGLDRRDTIHIIGVIETKSYEEEIVVNYAQISNQKARQ